MTHILESALLGLMEQAATAVATLVEDLSREELLRSRLTRREVLRQLVALADSARQVDATIRSALPELDWSGWDTMRARFDLPAGDALDEALWFACESLVPATVLWLRFYQHSQPSLFRMTP